MFTASPPCQLRRTQPTDALMNQPSRQQGQWPGLLTASLLLPGATVVGSTCPPTSEAPPPAPRQVLLRLSLDKCKGRPSLSSEDTHCCLDDSVRTLSSHGAEPQPIHSLPLCSNSVLWSQTQHSFFLLQTIELQTFEGNPVIYPLCFVSSKH